MNELRIGTRAIGTGHPCFVIAEAGVNHNGDEALALRLVEAAAEAGADAVKFQTFKADALVSPDAQKAAYQKETTGAHEGQLAMLRRLELPAETFARLRDAAHARGLLFLSTPFDDESARELVALGMPAIKVPSGELTNHLFLRRLARFGLPMLVSTGMADMAEVEAAVALLRHAVPGIGLFHCVSSYPAPPEDANLRAMEAMCERLRVPVGFSDHTLGGDVAVAAAALGASMIEKHLTLDCGMEGPDHRASLEPAAFAAMVRGIRAAQAALGDGIKAPRPSEEDVRIAARRSLHTARGIRAGELLGTDDLLALRPGDGIAADRLDDVVGRRAARDLPARHRLAPGDLA
jgi:N-acetylneuraminate synthase/N,N'-diacetyllegionaminate synthase